MKHTGQVKYINKKWSRMCTGHNSHHNSSRFLQICEIFLSETMKTCLLYLTVKFGDNLTPNDHIMIKWVRSRQNYARRTVCRKPQQGLDKVWMTLILIRLGIQTFRVVPMFMTSHQTNDACMQNLNCEPCGKKCKTQKLIEWSCNTMSSLNKCFSRSAVALILTVIAGDISDYRSWKP